MHGPSRIIATSVVDCIRMVFVFPAVLFVGQANAASLQQQRVDYQAAETALKRGDSRTFEANMQRLTDYPLYPYLLYKKIKRQPVDPATVRRYMDTYTNMRYTELLRSRLLHYYADSGQWSQFIESYNNSSGTALQCLYYRGLAQTGRVDEAAAGARKLWLVGDSRPEECDRLFAWWRTSPSFSNEMIWRRIKLAMTEGKSGLAKYLARSLPASDIGLVDFWLKIHNSPQRVLKCSHWDRRHSKLGWVFAHGIDRLARDNPDRAIAVWDARLGEFDLSAEESARINRRLGMSLALSHDGAAFERLNRVDPAYDDADSRAWRVRAALYAKNWSGVLQAIEKLDTGEKSELKWRYWRARALRAEGDTVQSEALFRDIASERDYYGFLAADQLGIEYAFRDHPIAVDPARFAALQNNPGFLAAKELFYFGRDAEAMRQWWYALDRQPRPEKMLAAKLAESWDRLQLAVFTVAKARAWDDLGLRFPLKYTVSVMKYARQRELQPSIVLGVIRQESIFNPRVRSSAGARGLMQIMPATGRLVARKLNESMKSVNRLYDPDLNVRYGTYYLQDLLLQFGQNLAMAAAGYNAGPHRARRWQPETGSLPADIWIENVPFRETRKYVRYVIGYTLVYQYRLGEVQHKISSYMGDVPAKLSRRSRAQVTDIVRGCGG